MAKLVFGMNPSLDAFDTRRVEFRDDEGALVDAQDLPDQPWESPEAGIVAAVILQGICR